MSVRVRFQGHGFPSLVTTNTAHRQRIFRSAAAVRMFLDVIGEVRRDTNLELYAWVVMPDHVHLVLRTTPPLTMGHAMQLMKGRFANRYNDFLSRKGPVWQDRYHARVLTSDKALTAAIEYVHHNPVAAGFVVAPEDFLWSSAKLFLAPEPRGVELLPG